ncbi:Uncharacterized protein PECH_000687 [Penicillium ucsense]|uniref:AAA+ ATPase domain-containing protein n=1 Tax=Penicillium ucsense TaxID=2839758 RepID=A0A8J8W3H0_9EURO|nr:Uncharacterized protein PECM_004962 [Penicillium ucsense]KAF7738412.1 Uncharacterized protein PECH_000687 [Penicillium ucsense]
MSQSQAFPIDKSSVPATAAHSSKPPPPPPPPPARNPKNARTSNTNVTSKGPAHGDLPGVEQNANDFKCNDTVVFSWAGDTLETIDFDFPRTNDDNLKGTVTLRQVVTNYAGIGQSRKVAAERLYMSLGRLRCLDHAIVRYNAGLRSQTSEFFQYWRRHTLSLLSGFGFRSNGDSATIEVIGLTELINQVEEIAGPVIRAARELITNGMLSFDGLGELFRPDIPVKCTSVPGCGPCVYRVTDSFFEERRTLFGSQKIFNVTMEVVVSVGNHFSVATFSESFTAWTGGRNRNLADFTYRPVTPNELQGFHARGQQAVRYGLGGAKYLAYAPGAFFVHTARSRREVQGMSQASNSSLSHSGGRIMVDMARGSLLGHYPCQGVEEATLAIIQVAGRYRQWLSKHARTDDSETDGLILWDSVPSEFVIFCWPALVGFSFTIKAWGHVLVDGLSPIHFQDDAFDRLVLKQERKDLIRAVVRHGTASSASDLIGGKQGGQIFLLHGPPGVGKTLTAEAIAEVLHRPLYYVTMGELGVTPEDLERRLSDVLGLCAEWDALAVLDEADVFLETRSTSDLIRNAMVCVMLRILEYHPGILFLTTNRVRTIDPAFESRITVALRYQALDEEARMKIWKDQVGRLKIESTSGEISFDALAKVPLNGRQIKNASRLAVSLAAEKGSLLSERLLLDTVEIISLGHQNILADNTWDVGI